MISDVEVGVMWQRMDVFLGAVVERDADLIEGVYRELEEEFHVDGARAVAVMMAARVVELGERVAELNVEAQRLSAGYLREKRRSRERQEIIDQQAILLGKRRAA